MSDQSPRVDKPNNAKINNKNKPPDRRYEIHPGRETDRATDEGCKAGAQFQVMPAAPRQSPAEPPGVLRPPSRPSATAARGERPPAAAGGAALAAAARPPPTPARAKCRATGIRAPGWGGKKRY